MLANLTSETIEGTWEEISQHASEFNGHRLRVIILPEEVTQGKMIVKGMFPELAQLGPEDFKIAEFNGNLNDDLEWNA